MNRTPPALCFWERADKMIIYVPAIFVEEPDLSHHHAQLSGPRVLHSPPALFPLP